MNASISTLTTNDIDEILDLQATVYDALDASEKAFIIPKSRNCLAAIFASGGTVIGVRSGGKLIAQSVAVNPSRAHPDTGMVDMPFSAPPETISIFQGVVVHPDMRGQHLGAQMCKHWVDACQNNGRQHLMAETALSNIASQKIFFSQKMPVTGLGVDPNDGTVVCNHYRDLKDVADVFNKAAGKWVLVSDEHEVRASLKDGNVAFGHKKQGDEFHFLMSKP